MDSRAFALIRSTFFAALFMSLWTWFVPRWIAAGRHVPFDFQPNPVAIILIVIGAAIGLWCVFAFAWSGRGTPAPFDPPRRLVVHGLYRWMRNPMYVGLVLILLGEAIALPAIRREMFILIAVVWLLSTILIVAHEEPSLRAKFGDDYADYCRHVHRWLPRLRPFDKAPSGS